MYRRLTFRQFIAVLLSVVLVNFAISWTVVRLSEKKWCELISTLDEGYNAPVSGAPERSPRGTKIGADIHDLRVRKLHC
jgi:hypothetical protein